MQSCVQVFAAAWIAGRDERSRRLALQADACGWLGREGKRAFEVFSREDRVAVQHERFADRFFLGELFFCESECFGTVARATVSGDRLVEREDADGFGGSLLGILKPALVISGLNVVMGQLLDCTLAARAATLESFSDAARYIGGAAFCSL